MTMPLLPHERWLASLLIARRARPPVPEWMIRQNEYMGVTGMRFIAAGMMGILMGSVLCSVNVVLLFFSFRNAAFSDLSTLSLSLGLLGGLLGIFRIAQARRVGQEHRRTNPSEQ
jgi:hypothetical protein